MRADREEVEPSCLGLWWPMSIIYVVSDYGRLIKKGDVLQLRKGDDLLKTIFPFKTEQLVIIGRIEITSAAINLLMRHQIDTVFLHRNGRFNGKFAFASGKNVFLRQKQFKSIEDDAFTLEFARCVVRGKLRNQLTFMQRTLRTKSVNDLTPLTFILICSWLLCSFVYAILIGDLIFTLAQGYGFTINGAILVLVLKYGKRRPDRK